MHAQIYYIVTYFDMLLKQRRTARPVFERAAHAREYIAAHNLKEWGIVQIIPSKING